MLATSTVIIYRCYSPLPFQDSWSFWQRYLHFGNIWAFLAEPHNEHRIVITRLAYLADMIVFRGRGILPLIASLILQALSGAGIYILTCASRGLTPSSRILFACVICACLASMQQFDNLVKGFQIQFTMVDCASCAALLAMIAAARRIEKQRSPDTWFAVSCICALVAALSSGNGLFFWPVLAVFAIWLRLPGKYVAALVFDTVVVAAFYFWQYHVNPQPSGLAAFLRAAIRTASFVGSPFDVLRTVLTPLAGPATDDGRAYFTAAFGAAGCLLFARDAVVLRWHPSRFSAERAALLHLAGFAIVSGALVGLGRGEFPLASALDNRYVTFGFVFWLALLGFHWPVVDGWISSVRPIPRALVQASILCALLALAWRQFYWLESAHAYAKIVGGIQDAIVSDVYDEARWKTSYPGGGGFIFSEVDYLRRNRLSIFSEPWTHWTGHFLNIVFEVDAQRTCEGYIDTAVPLGSTDKPGWRVSGWAWDPAAQRGPGTVILVDPQGLIAGVADEPVDRGDVRQVVAQVHSSLVGWTGYVAGSRQPHLRAYLVERNGRSVCEVRPPSS